MTGQPQEMLQLQSAFLPIKPQATCICCSTFAPAAPVTSRLSGSEPLPRRQAYLQLYHGLNPYYQAWLLRYAKHVQWYHPKRSQIACTNQLVVWPLGSPLTSTGPACPSQQHPPQLETSCASAATATTCMGGRVQRGWARCLLNLQCRCHEPCTVVPARGEDAFHAYQVFRHSPGPALDRHPYEGSCFADRLACMQAACWQSVDMMFICLQYGH